LVVAWPLACSVTDQTPQPGAVTLADGVPRIVDRAVINLHSVQDARNEIGGAAEPLGGIDFEASELINTLTLLKQVEALHTTTIRQKAFDIMVMASTLTASMMIMGAENRRTEEPQQLGPTDAAYRHLMTMLGQLNEARETLGRLMTGVLVGLAGNPRDGFHVVRDSLLSTNGKVRSVLGRNLVLYDFMEERLLENTGE